MTRGGEAEIPEPCERKLDYSSLIGEFSQDTERSILMASVNRGESLSSARPLSPQHFRI